MESKKPSTEKEFSSNNAVDVTEKLDQVDGGMATGCVYGTCPYCGGRVVVERMKQICTACGKFLD